MAWEGRNYVRVERTVCHDLRNIRNIRHRGFLPLQECSIDQLKHHNQEFYVCRRLLCNELWLSRGSLLRRLFHYDPVACRRCGLAGSGWHLCNGACFGRPRRALANIVKQPAWETLLVRGSCPSEAFERQRPVLFDGPLCRNSKNRFLSSVNAAVNSASHPSRISFP